ncbi:30S ribosomal protein S8e [Candidatus Woesearchaeota archaeon]|nr:30S ribosomal protein S8e [Candidatus Woesearchaeota archaeon]MBW3021674.1 30S ribosomal protein S8e [Candidatus Woesearchaeota archaeon]
MVRAQHRSKRKQSGTKYQKARKKRKFELARNPSNTKVGETSKKNVRTRGNNLKQRLLEAEFANIVDPKTKKFEKVKIKGVIENKANRHYVRRNIITKGCVVDTDKGKAKVTSRPGQDGTVNAVLVK